VQRREGDCVLSTVKQGVLLFQIRPHKSLLKYASFIEFMHVFALCSYVPHVFYDHVYLNDSCEKKKSILHVNLRKNSAFIVGYPGIRLFEAEICWVSSLLNN
jgi:hypothetical protein